ncbi:MAG: DUF2156 domain-containing protein [Clostridia bacterium]
MSLLKFDSITLEHKPIIDLLYKELKLRNSEYTFTNLYIWGANGKIKIAETEDAVFFLLQYGTEKPFMFAPLLKPGGDFERAVSLSSEHLIKLGAAPRFFGVCDFVKDEFLKLSNEYKLKEDRDNYDYVYATKDLINLSGKRYHAKRNHINRFAYEYEFMTLHSFDLPECMNVYDKWLQTKDVFQSGVMGERDAIKRIIEHSPTLDVKIGGIRIDGKLVAFTVGENITEDSGLIHIEKAESGYEGLFTLINRDFIEHEFINKIYINREEDMGLPGLRKAKLSYYPEHFIEKYIAEKII